MVNRHKKNITKWFELTIFTMIPTVPSWADTRITVDTILAWSTVLACVITAVVDVFWLYKEINETKKKQTNKLANDRTWRMNDRTKKHRRKSMNRVRTSEYEGLTTKLRYLKALDTRLSPLSLGYSETAFLGVTTRTCDMRLGGRAHNPVGNPQHLQVAPGDPCVPHRYPLPSFNHSSTQTNELQKKNLTHEL